jgi:hypothetical protein
MENFPSNGLWNADFRPDGAEIRFQRRSGPQRILSQHSLGWVSFLAGYLNIPREHRVPHHVESEIFRES